MLKQAPPHAHRAAVAAAAGAKFQHGERVMVKWSKPSADGRRPIGDAQSASMQPCLIMMEATPPSAMAGTGGRSPLQQARNGRPRAARRARPPPNQWHPSTTHSGKSGRAARIVRAGRAGRAGPAGSTERKHCQ